jgi:hypothetical protein
MAIKPQVLAAISGAISTYVADEEAALSATMAQVSLPPTPANLWGVAGRQTASQMRMLVQRRSFK